MNNKNILFNWRFLLILSSAICALVAIVFKILSIQFIDSNSIIRSSDKDPIHWSKETHHVFGKEIAKILLKDIKP